MTDSKEKLLQYFAGLDIPTLQKLQKYSKLLIIPDEDLLTNATMSQMVEKAHSLADALFPSWTDRSKSDFGEFLIEVFSVFSEKDFWYINAFANEGILRKMRSYSNAFSKASSMGYRPITCKGAISTFSVSFKGGEAATYGRGDLIVDVEGVKFTNDEGFSIGKSATEITKQLLLYEGTQVAEDITYSGYNVLIRKKDVDVESIRVVIDNVEYSQVRNFGFSSQDSSHFMVLPEEDGSCSIFFGNNGFGYQPPIGKAIRVEYRKCSGAAGNSEIRQAQIGDSYPDRPAVKVSMITPAEGGNYAETLTSIKECAPLYFNTKRAAINEAVSQDIINSFPFVHKSKVSVVGREVVYQIIPASGYLEPTASEIRQIEQDFYPYIMAGYRGVYSINQYKNLLRVSNSSATHIIVDVIVSYGTNSEFVEAAVRQIMDDVTNPLVKANYGGSFSKNSTELLIRSSVPNVQSVSFKLKIGLDEPIMPDVIIQSTEIFSSINQNELIVRINAI